MYLPRAAAACITGIVIPLYIYPGEDCVAWQPLLDTIANGTSIPLVTVVNPISGPGEGSSQPDANFQACIPKLRSANVNNTLVGYVRTGYNQKTDVPQDKILTDISTYAGWDSAYSMDGIYFDETNATQDNSADYQAYTGKMRNTSWAKSPSFLAMNPGTTVEDNSFFGLADTITTYEHDFNGFKTDLIKTGPDTPASKQSVMLYEAPCFTDYTSTIQSLVKDVQVGQIFVTDRTFDENPYGGFPKEWSAFISAMSSASCSE